MGEPARYVAERLARNAEAICRHYLPNGRREGRYWLVGDIQNSPGRSLYVRIKGPERGHGAAGKWTDAATGEHGDLLDLIAAREGLRSVGATVDKARDLLSLPQSVDRDRKAPRGSSEAARRLFAASRAITDTPAETYLRRRRLDPSPSAVALRYHPRCFYRPAHDDAPNVRAAWPALIAAVTDARGLLVGVQRTWLASDGIGKAPVASPRRAMGQVLGGAVRFGPTSHVMAAGEGIETVLSVRTVLPTLSMVAAGSAAHLGGLEFPAELRRLYVVEDVDAAGRRATERLTDHGRAAGVEVLPLRPVLGDFNEDLLRFGPEALRSSLLSQLAPGDVERFWLKTFPRHDGTSGGTARLG